MFWVNYNGKWIYNGTLEQCQKLCDDLKISYHNICSAVARLLTEE